jgi:hypothetical protein
MFGGGLPWSQCSSAASARRQRVGNKYGVIAPNEDVFEVAVTKICWG